MPSINKSRDPLGTYHLAQHPDLFTPARSNNFVFYPQFKNRLLKEGVSEATATDNDYISAEYAQEVLMLSVNEASVPHMSQNVIEVKRGNTVMKFAGAVNYDAGSLKFEDYIGADTKSALYAWRRLAFNKEDETIGRAEDYKITATLVEYTPDHRQIRYWELFGVWVSDISEDSFQQESDGKRVVSVSISYDRAIEHLPDDNEIIDESVLLNL